MSRPVVPRGNVSESGHNLFPSLSNKEHSPLTSSLSQDSMVLHERSGVVRFPLKNSVSPLSRSTATGEPSNRYTAITRRRCGSTRHERFASCRLYGGREKLSRRFSSRPGSTTPYKLRRRRTTWHRYAARGNQRRAWKGAGLWRHPTVVEQERRDKLCSNGEFEG